MTVPDLSQVLINLTEIMPLLVQLTFIVMAVLGLIYGSIGIYTLYGVATGEHKFSNRAPTYESAFGKIALGGAMVVAPVLLWRFANSFVVGGDQTYSILNYTPTGSSYCDQIRIAISYFFMVVGVFAWFFGFMKIYEATNNHSHRAGSASVYLIGGVLCFFINDVAALISTTTGMDIGLTNICSVVGG